jgi:hypothetical protein
LASQAKGRGFEPRRPLLLDKPKPGRLGIPKTAFGFARHGYVGPVRVLAPMAVATVVAALAMGANAAAQQTGTLVVRLATDPAPPGMTWKYSGAGPAFKLGQAATEQTVALQPGSYQLYEADGRAGQPHTLTALVCVDPSGDTTTSVAQASASVVLQDGETVTCTFTHRALGALPAAAKLALARTYAPVLRLSAGEPYRPLRLEDYLSVSTLHSGVPPHGPLLQTRPTLFSLPAVAGSFYLDVSGADPNSHASRYPGIEQRLRGSRPRATVYFHVVRQPATGRVAIEYWFLYLYNDFYDKHEADWEGVTVYLHGTSPLGVSYSAHQGRRWSPWASQSTQNGTHPVVYVAYGSHANYSARGRYSIRVCWTLHGRRQCAITPKADVASGTGTKLAPSGYGLLQLGGAPYAGDWGSGNYILGIGRTSDHVTDPRRRSDYTNPFAILAG